MTFLEIPEVVTARLRLRAFHAGDLDSSAAIQGSPAVTHHLPTGRSEICGAG
jgi:hypothetical protein